jgi:hypothetical protein
LCLIGDVKLAADWLKANDGPSQPSKEADEATFAEGRWMGAYGLN